MRILLLSISSLLLITSCSKYQCVAISSDNTDRNEKNEFFIENDSFRVTFNFYDRRGTVRVSIFNKTSEIIGVNWSKSFVIVNENPSPFFNPEIHVQGELDKAAYSHSVTLNATAAQPLAIQYIPPQTAVNHTGLALTQGRFIDAGNYRFKKESVRIQGLAQKIERAKIEKSNSPLQFRIYLTLVPEGSVDSAPLVLERSFFVSELINTYDERPAAYLAIRNGNMIIMKKSTTAGTVLKITTTIGLVALLCVAAGK